MHDDKEETGLSDMAGLGHNSGEPREVQGIAGKRLISFIERIERLEEEKSGISEDIKEVYYEAKSTGFDKKIIRKIVRLRKIDADKRREEEELESLYRAAIGMEDFSATPLGTSQQNGGNA